MKLYSSEIPTDRSDVLYSKYAYGIWFGAILGLTFSVFAWGMDAIQLNLINGLYPWLKFLVGVVPCSIVGAFTGWLSAKVEKPFWAMLFWIIAASVFAWLSVSLPLRLTPRLLSLMEPDLQALLHYTDYGEIPLKFGVAYFWLALLAALVGLLQIPLSDSAIYSTSVFGKISPLLLTMILMAISGNTMDNLNNELLRSPIYAINETTQFYIDHRGEKIDLADTRRMHLASLRPVEGMVTPDRKFIISSFDETFGDVRVLARFQNAWVECEVFYDQPISCEQAGKAP
jgi:hypothetical protein